MRGSSMVGRKVFGQVDRRLRQVFPHRVEEMFGGCSCILIGDWGQLPPVMDLPLYTTVSRTGLSDLGSANYHLFDRAVVLDQVMRQAGQDVSQKTFRDILLRLRNAQCTLEDWKHLMSRTAAEDRDASRFDHALHLYSTAAEVAEYNANNLRAGDQPIANIKAVHSGPGAAKASNEDAGGLGPVLCIAQGARVMLCSNLWVEVGLVNSAIGTVVAVCYETGHSPPEVPVAVTVKFDSYTGRTLPDSSVPIAPIRRSWFGSGKHCSRLQIPLKLAWAITIHKSQGMTLGKVVVDVGKKEFSSGLTFVACYRVRRLSDLLFVPPFPFHRLTSMNKSNRLKERLQEDAHLESMSSKPLGVTNAAKVPPNASKVNTAGAVPSNQRAHLPKDRRPHSIPPSRVTPPPPPATTPAPTPPPKDGSGKLDDPFPDGGSSTPVACPFRYNPVDVEWQQETCRAHGLKFKGPNGVKAGNPTLCLKNPASLRRIRGDGNCLFRSISFIITGEEEQHEAIRQALVRHMRSNERLLCGYANLREGLEQYISSSRVDCVGSWVSDVEMNILSHWLGIDVFSFNPLNGPTGAWWRMTMFDTPVGSRAVYINHPPDHVEVVTSVVEGCNCQVAVPTDEAALPPMHWDL